MTTAGTGALLLTNPPFIMGNPRPSHLNDYLTYALHMDTNQPTTADGLPELTEDEFLRLSAEAGGADRPFMACNYGHALRIAQLAFTAGADLELEACCEWVRDGNGLLNRFQKQADDMRADRRPKPPSLREQALAQLDVLHADLGAHGLGTNTDAIRRALEALPE